MAAKKISGTGQVLDIGSLFEQELQSRNEDLRKQAATRMFEKLHPSNRVTVDQFLTGIQQHKDVWAAVSTMGILDFAATLAGGRRESEPSSKPSGKAARRSRLSDAQKNSLKGLIVNVLSGIKDGLSRREIAANTNDELLGNVGVVRAELMEKLRQPLHELGGERRIHTVGEKRLMKYYAGADPKRK